MKKIQLTDLIQKSGKAISLSQSEREKILRVTREYMAMKPMRLADVVQKALPSPYPFMFLRKPAAVALIALLAVSSGAGISYAAEGALPGDLLYPVKVSVNEEVRALVAFSPEAKAELEARRAEKRLTEAVVLASEGKLNAEAQAELASRFEKHADRAAAQVALLEAHDAPVAVDVASRFETRIAAHLEILDEVTGTEGRNIRDRVFAKVGVLALMRSNAETAASISAPVALARTAADASAESGVAALMSAPAEEAVSMKMAAPESAPFANAEAVKLAALRMHMSATASFKEIDRVFDHVKRKLSESEKKRVETVLAEAETNIEIGDASFAAADFNAAFHAYQSAVVSLAKMNVYLKTVLRGDIRIRIEPVPLPGPVILPGPVPSDSDSDPETEPVSRPLEDEVEDSPLPVEIRIGN